MVASCAGDVKILFMFKSTPTAADAGGIEKGTRVMSVPVNGGMLWVLGRNMYGQGYYVVNNRLLWFFAMYV